MSAFRRRFSAALAVLAGTTLLALPGCSPGESTGDDGVTFNADVAPILFENCAVCHRPGGSGPFNLLTYRDARKRARQLVEVTGTGYMPPWLPEPGYVEFAAARGLNSTERQTLARWVEQGTVEGSASDLPEAPSWKSGWQSGEPDLVVELGAPYTLAADGEDVYRNFVIPVEVEKTHYVKAVEFRPGNPQIVHHGRLLIDRTPSSRSLDARDEEPGWDGMTWGNAETPDGILLGWTPGKLPMEPVEGMAWRLGPGTDLVLQLHMIPSGKPESIRPSIGLYFAEQPPTLHPFAFVMGSREIDIPAGEARVPVTDEYVLPVDVEFLGIYPHAHYLAKQMHAFAELPDGTRHWLLRIDDWDFNWQDEYRYASPIALPRGTRVIMEYTYDNSSDNVRNPNVPPRRVTYGARSSDEMAELMLNALPRDPDDRAALEMDFERHKVENAIAFRLALIKANPDDVESHAALGSTYLYVGRIEQAIVHLREGSRLTPLDPTLRNNLAYALRRQGRVADAIEQYRNAVGLDRNFEAAHFGLANALLADGRADDAITHYVEVLRIRPEAAEGHHALGRALKSKGRYAEAQTHLEQAVQFRPDSAIFINDLAWDLATCPDAALRRPALALELAGRATALTRRSDAGVLASLAAAHAANGAFEAAIVEAEAAATLARGTPQAAEIQRQLALYRDRRPFSKPRRDER